MNVIEPTVEGFLAVLDSGVIELLARHFSRDSKGTPDSEVDEWMADCMHWAVEETSLNIGDAMVGLATRLGKDEDFNKECLMVFKQKITEATKG